ncbi:MAG: hypothetical protein KC731_38615, partial [Myxococcales bacterium]|nr:hypothetical protein [Myxococcales bacterium]
MPDELPIEVHCIGVTSAHAFASDQGMTALAQLGLSRLPTGALRQTPSQREAPSLRRIDSTPQVVAGDHVELRDLHGELLISLPAGAHEVVDLRAAAWVVTPAFEARLPDLVAEGRLYVGGVAAAKLPMALHRLTVDAARGQLWLIYRGVLAKPPRGGDPVMAVALAAAGTVIPWPASVGRRVVASKPGFDETVVLRDADAEPKDLTATLAVSPRHAAREQAPFALAPAGKKGGDQPAEAPPSGAGLPWKDGDERPVPQLPSEGLEVTVGLGEADDVAAARALLEARELAEKKERAAVAAQERGSGR